MKLYSDYEGVAHAEAHPENFEFHPHPGDGYNGYQRVKCYQCGMVIVQLDKRTVHQTKHGAIVTTSWALEHFLIVEWP